MQYVPRCTTQNQDSTKARTREFETFGRCSPQHLNWWEEFCGCSLLLVFGYRFAGPAELYGLAWATPIPFPCWTFCRTLVRSSVARVSQVSCRGVFPQAPACTHDAGFLCNLKLFCYSSSAVTKGRESTDIPLEQEAGRDPLCA